MAETVNCARTTFENPELAPWVVGSLLSGGSGLTVTVGTGGTYTLSVDFDVILTDGTEVLIDSNGNVLTT